MSDESTLTAIAVDAGGDALLRERCAHAYYRLRWKRDDWKHMEPVHREAYYEVADAILAEIAAAGFVIVDSERYERLRAYVVADQEFRQADTWAGIWQPDEVPRKAIELQYAGREKRRREAQRILRDREEGK